MSGDGERAGDAAHRGRWSPATCPRSDILNGVSIDGPRGRDRHHRRPQRRRQVDADQDHLRAPAPALGADRVPRRGASRAASRTTSPASASATCRSSTTSSRASRSRRTSRWASLDRSRTAEQIERMYELFPRLGERMAQAAGTMSGGERQMVAMARALMPDPADPAARRALGRARAGLRRRDLREDRGGQPRRRDDRDGRAERPPRAGDVRSRLRARPRARTASRARAEQLLADPKVAELYLGGTAARRPDRRAGSTEARLVRRRDEAAAVSARASPARRSPARERPPRTAGTRRPRPFA